MEYKGYLLLVEDEHLVQESNKRILERRGYSTRQAYNLADARSIIAEKMPRAIVLDIQLPDGNGLDFLHELRQVSNIPVLMLTSMGTPEDIIRGLESGGDDYLSKPYGLPIFLTRVEALLRRASIIPEKLIFGAITIDTASNRAYIDGVDMVLSPKELSLLEQFIQHPEKIMSAESLYEKVWGQKMLENDNALRKVVSSLRPKLESSGYTIFSSKGEGYCFERL